MTVKCDGAVELRLNLVEGLNRLVRKEKSSSMTEVRVTVYAVGRVSAAYRESFGVASLSHKYSCLARDSLLEGINCDESAAFWDSLHMSEFIAAVPTDTLFSQNWCVFVLFGDDDAVFWKTSLREDIGLEKHTYEY
jgi:hypothetical protein